MNLTSDIDRNSFMNFLDSRNVLAFIINKNLEIIGQSKKNIFGKENIDIFDICSSDLSIFINQNFNTQKDLNIIENFFGEQCNVSLQNFGEYSLLIIDNILNEQTDLIKEFNLQLRDINSSVLMAIENFKNDDLELRKKLFNMIRLINHIEFKTLKQYDLEIQSINTTIMFEEIADDVCKYFKNFKIDISGDDQNIHVDKRRIFTTLYCIICDLLTNNPDATLFINIYAKKEHVFLDMPINFKISQETMEILHKSIMLHNGLLFIQDDNIKIAIAKSSSLIVSSKTIYPESGISLARIELSEIIE